MKVHDDTGLSIDAEFDYEVDSKGGNLIFASGGGGRNLKYGSGLELVLGRLCEAGAIIEDVLVASSDTEGLEESERRVQLQEFPYPIAMATVTEARELRLSIGRAVAQIGRAPDAKGAGNREKRLTFLLASSPAVSAEQLAFGHADRGRQATPSGRDANKTRRTWALLCNPELFDIETASEELDQGTWDLPAGDPVCGDRIIFWKAKGFSDRRGIAAFGEVLHAPARRTPDPESARYWRESRSPASERRIVVRYLRPVCGPLWETAETRDLLSGLSVSRGQGNKLYVVTPDTCHEVVSAMGGWPSSSSEEERRTDGAEKASRPRGQAWASSPEHREAVELRAMAAAQECLEALGYSLRDTSASKPYDLVARRGDERLFVEVKGTKNAGERVLLTKNEVNHVLANPGSCALFIQHGITVHQTAAGLVGLGGQGRLITGWVPDKDDLMALTFQYRVPQPDDSGPATMTAENRPDTD